MSSDSLHLPLRFEIVEDEPRGHRVAWVNAPGAGVRLNAEELREMALGLLDAATDLARAEGPGRGCNGSAH